MERRVQFEYTEPQTEIERMVGGHFCINAHGPIEPGDGQKFRDFLARVNPPPRIPVYIDSTGGDVDAAIEIGRAIRERWSATSIGSCLLDHENATSYSIPRKYVPGKCLSAATLIYIGGRLRYYPEDSEFGVHRFSFKNPSPGDVEQSQRISAKIAGYVAEMVITPEFLEISSNISSGSLEIIPEARLRELKISTGGVTEATWTTNANNGAVYVRGERDSIYGHQKVLLGFRKKMGFFFWAVIEAQGREDELMRFPSVEISFEEERANIDISDRCTRWPMEGYVHVMVPISQDEAAQLAYSTGFGVCIRATNEAPVFLGAAPLSTEGGADALQSFFQTLSSD